VPNNVIKDEVLTKLLQK